MGANGGHPERTLDRKAARRMAEALVAAEAAAKPIPPLTHRHRALSPAEAYAIQFTAAGLQRTFGSLGTVAAKFV